MGDHDLEPLGLHSHHHLIVAEPGRLPPRPLGK
jgi:hypothetical protein